MELLQRPLAGSLGRDVDVDPEILDRAGVPGRNGVVQEVLLARTGPRFEFVGVHLAVVQRSDRAGHVCGVNAGGDGRAAEPTVLRPLGVAERFFERGVGVEYPGRLLGGRVDDGLGDRLEDRLEPVTLRSESGLG